MADTVRFDVDGRVATVTVDRPEKRNAMDIDTRRALRRTLEDAATDDDVRVVVLRGAGEDAFVTGGDIADFADFDHVDGLKYVTEHAQGLYNYVATLPKPTIAAVDGYALGGGMEVAMACDVRLATPDSQFGLPEVSIGILPAGGGTQRLAAIAGAGVAKELILTGRILDAAEADELGIVNHIHPRAAFDDAVESMAVDIAEKAPLALRLAKESINRGLDLEGGLDFERIAGAYLFGTDDQTEGATAFEADRDPTYRGR